MGCNCGKKKKVQEVQEPVKQEIKVPQSVDELHSMLMKQHAEELAREFRDGNINQSNETSE